MNNNQKEEIMSDDTKFGGSKKPKSILKKIMCAFAIGATCIAGIWGITSISYNAGKNAGLTPEPTNDKAETNENSDDTTSVGGNANNGTTSDSGVKNEETNIGDNLVTSNNKIQVVLQVLSEVYTEKLRLAGKNAEGTISPVYIHLEGDYSLAVDAITGIYYKFSMNNNKDAESLAEMTQLLYDVKSGTYTGDEDTLKADVKAYFMSVVSSRNVTEASVKEVATNVQDCLVAPLKVHAQQGKATFLMAVLVGEKIIEVDYVKDGKKLTVEDYQAVAENAVKVLENGAGEYEVDGSTYTVFNNLTDVLKNLSQEKTNEDVER